MKRLSRLTALLLAIMLSLSMIPAALAEEVMTKNQLDEIGDGAVQLFYEQLMACQTHEEVMQLFSTMSDENLAAIASRLTEEQIAASTAHMEQLYEVYMEESFYPVTVDFDNVAPFKAPVSGPQMRLMAARAVSPYAEGDTSDNGIELSKTVSDTPNANGEYTLTLEAFATGSKVVTETEVQVPVDIILVLDQSGSMAEDMTSYTYNAVYSLEESYWSEYYVKGEAGYERVTWCRTCNAWTIGCEYGWGGHSAGTVYTPKTSESDTTAGSVQFYTPGNQTSTQKLAALKTAVTTFVNQIYAKAKGADGQLGTADDVAHRVAVVGFASGDTYGWSDYNYGNTELFVGKTQYTYNAGSANSASNANSAQSHYTDAFQAMNTEAGYNNVIASKEALSANGGTIINLGMEMANGILQANPVPAGETRARVVIAFTDGIPGWEGYDSDVASSAITQANTAKSTYGATVYSVGIFAGADATSAGNQNGNDTAKANWFMQNLSSNNGTVSNPGYYLSASDADTLNNIFQTISDQIESDSTSVTLGEESVVQDVISDYFVLPADVTKERIEAMIVPYAGNGSWNVNGATAISPDNITLDAANKTVSVTGFSYKDNYVYDNPDAENPFGGSKVVLQIPIKVRDGFLGGNNVLTNADGSGIFANADDAEDPSKAVEDFTSPDLDVAIPAVSVTAAEKNVYLLGDLSNDQLLDGATVKVGDVKLNFKAENFGLEEWQNAYVTIGNPTSGKEENAYSNLTADTTFTVSATVTPTLSGSVKEVSGSSRATINVFKPVLKFQDTTVDYMSTVANPGDFDAYNYVVSESSDDTTPVLTEYPQWVHNGTLAASAKPEMIGEKPALKLTYNPDAGIDSSDVVVSTTDVAVDVTVSIKTGKDESTDAFTYEDVTDHVTFIRAACEHTECANYNKVSTHPGNEADVPEFVLHVINVVGNLTITKSGLNVNTYAKTSEYSDYESAIFTVSGDYDGDGKEDIFTVVIPCPGPEGSGSVTLTGLRVGKYKVTEQTGWTWRYGTSTITDNYVVDGESTASDGVVKVEGNQPAQVRCENSGHTDKWLGGDNYATNVFGASNLTEVSENEE